MTVKLLAQWGDQPPGTLFTAATAGTETAMIAAGQATANLAGGVVWVPPGNSPGIGLSVYFNSVTRSLVDGDEIFPLDSAVEPTVCAYYSPTITHGVVYNGAETANSYRYNHDSSIEYFDGKWFCAWNLNTNRLENVAGQWNAIATSDNFSTWTAPQREFSDAAYSTNPVAYSAGSSIQWQPNLLAISGKLLCTWVCDVGTFVSYKTSAAGKWTNIPVTYSFTRGGVAYTNLFPTQNPIKLPSGRIVAPAILSSAGSTAPDQSGHFGGGATYPYRLATAMISDDDGASWTIGGVAEHPSRAWGIWEPVFALQPDGVLRMFIRSQIEAETPTAMMMTATSADEGMTWSTLVPAGLNVPIARPGIVNGGDKHGVKYLLQNDYEGTDVNLLKRRGLSVYTGTGENDFVPGVGFNVLGDRPGHSAAYAQGKVKDGDLYIVYTMIENSTDSTGVMTAKVSPAPPAGAVSARPLYLEYTTPAALNGRNLVWGGKLQKFNWKTSTSGWSGNKLSFYTLVDAMAQGPIVALFDNRNATVSGMMLQIGTTGDPTDKLITLRYLNAGVLTNLSLGLSFPTYRAKVALQIAIDGVAQTATVWMIVDGVLTTNTVAIPIALSNIAGLVPYLLSSIAASTVSSFAGSVYRVRVWDALINQAGFLFLYGSDSALWPELGLPAVAGTATSPAGATINLNGSDGNALTNNAGWLANWTDVNLKAGNVTTTTFGGKSVVKISGKASASIAPASSGWDYTTYQMQYAAPTGRANPVGIITIGLPDNYIELTKVNGVASTLRILRPSSLDATKTLDVSSGSGQALQDGEFYNLAVKFQPGYVTIEHDRMAPITLPFNGRPAVFLGRAHNVYSLTSAEATDIVYFESTTISFSKTRNKPPRIDSVPVTGAWTPSLQFGGAAVGMTQAAGFPAGWIHRIGDVVHWSLDINLTAKGSSTGTATISGFPYTALTTNGAINAQGGVSLMANAMAAGVGASAITGTMAGSSLTLRYQSGGSTLTADDTLFTNSSRIRMSGWYMAVDPVRA
jgi:hypothetical protein